MRLFKRAPRAPGFVGLAALQAAEDQQRVTATAQIRDGFIVFTKNSHVVYRRKPSRLTRLRRYLKL